MTELNRVGDYFLSVLNEVVPLVNDVSYLMSFVVIGLAMLMAQIFNLLRCRSSAATATDRKVKIIIASWWRIIFFCFFAFWGGRYTMVPAFCLLTIFALRESVSVSGLRDHKTPLLVGGFTGMGIHYASFFLHSETIFFASFHYYLLLVLMPMIVFTSRLNRLAEVIAFYLATMVLIVFLSFPVAVVVFESERIGSEANTRLAVLILILLTELNDILQFTFGKLFGRCNVVPWISPNKTEAGFIGGTFVSTILGAFVWPFFLPVSMNEGALLGFLLSLGGIMGDLVCSGVKRYRGVKDFSNLLPGHGGAIDRMDSLLVTAPIFFYFIYWMI